MPPLMTPAEQHDAFVRGCELLGGQLRAAHATELSERTIRQIKGGTRRLGPGVLGALHRALSMRVEACDALARDIATLLPPEGDSAD